MKPIIRKSDFLEWYVNDKEDLETLGRKAYDSLSEDGFVLISVEELYFDCAYIPARLCNGYKGDEEDLDPQDVTLID